LSVQTIRILKAQFKDGKCYFFTAAAVLACNPRGSV